MRSSASRSWSSEAASASEAFAAAVRSEVTRQLTELGLVQAPKNTATKPAASPAGTTAAAAKKTAAAAKTTAKKSAGTAKKAAKTTAKKATGATKKTTGQS